jgi:predicted HAD superfamily Cof-like phosphohydrolase
MIKDIYDFNTQLLKVKTNGPKLLDSNERNWLLTALHEEIEEFLEATEKESLIGCVDSLLDLTYFAIGGCVRLGLTAEQIQNCFTAIHKANMGKKQGIKPSRPQNGTIADAIKPEGWEAPEEAINKILFPKETK